MKKWNQMMVLLAIAVTVVLAIANLHHLNQNANKAPGRSWSKPVGKEGLTFHIGLLPSVSINVFLNNQ